MIRFHDWSGRRPAAPLIALFALLLAVTGTAPLRAQAQTDEKAGQEKTEPAGEERTLRKRLVDATAQEEEWTPSFQMSPAEEQRELIQRGEAAMAAGQLDADGGAIPLLARAVAIDGGNSAAQNALTRAVGALVQRAETALAAGRFDEAARLGAVAERYRPQEPAVRALGATLAAGRQLAQQLVEAQRRFNAGNLVEPAGASALDAYREVLAKDAKNATASGGVAAIEARLLEQAQAAAQGGDYAGADRLLAQAATVQPGSQRVQDAGVQVMELRQSRAEAMKQDLLAAIGARDFDRAERVFRDLERVSVQGGELDALRVRLDNARNYASHSPGDVIADPVASGGKGPELVVIALGQFEMGSANREAGRAANEGPRFTVAFTRGFALGRNEITVEQFQRFVNATGFVTQAQRNNRATVYDEDSGTLAERAGIAWEHDHLGKKAAPQLPVINVSWDDAKAYTDWLSRETGQRYRLPSEAEFEYALRAGSTTPYPWGDKEPKELVGNVTGDGDRSETRRNWSNAFSKYSDGHWGPAPARTYPPNPFGLYDMVGNVSEWVEDCWHDGYQRAPADGSPWVNPGCNLRVIRGSSWASSPEQTRSAYRLSAPPATVNPRLGLRVLREF